MGHVVEQDGISDRSAIRLRPIDSPPSFATHIDRYAVSGHAALNAALLKDIAAWRAESPGLNSSNQLGWHSPRSLFRRNEPSFALLRQHILSALVSSLKRYWPDFNPAEQRAVFEGWVNCNGKGAFNTPHDHSGSHLSGSYYVSVPKTDNVQSGALEFLNPMGTSGPKLPNGNLMAQSKLTFQPTPGLMVVFPAFLRHWVYPNQENAERVSIAFNVRVLNPGEHMG